MPTPALSRRAQSLKPPATLAIMTRAKAMARRGIDVVSFALGEPDFDTPDLIKQAAIDALRANQTHYAPTIGDAETRAAIADKLVRDNGIPGLTADHVAISAGAKHSLYTVCQCLIDPPQPGEPAPEVLLPVPAWVSYGPIARLAGAKVVELPTTAASGFRITPDQLAAAITPRSRTLILNTPSNPCGVMYPPDELRALAAVVDRAARSTAPDLVIITDEIYEKIVYGGVPHLSIGSVPAVAERTVTINGLSKAFAMTGWRAGYAAAPGEFGLGLVRAIDSLQGQMTSCITSFVYPAIRAALTGAAGDTDRMRAEFGRRAVMAFDRLAAIPGVVCPRPTGAFYLFPDVSALYGRRTRAGRTIGSSAELAEALLDEAHVATVPGVEFGGCGDRHLRLSFACSTADLERGLDRVAAFAASLSERGPRRA